MSRSGYSDDCDGWALIRWRGAVKAAIHGKRGQRLLRELAEALDAMPIKELIPDELQTSSGEFCALGVLGAARGLALNDIDPDDREGVAKTFNIAPALVAEIVYVNDEYHEYWGRWQRGAAPRTLEEMAAEEKAGRERRWRTVRAWVAEQLKPAGQP